MRLMIAGWQGQIARAMVEAAPSRADISACAFGRPALDICEPRSIERALAQSGPDVVINLAAYTAVDRAEAEPERAFALNCEGARLLAEAARRRGVPIIHISTDQVFDGRKRGPYIEDDVPAPLSVYGRSRLAGEEAIAAANPAHVILRAAWIFSAAGNNFVRTILRRVGDDERLRVVADQHGNPTYAPHLVAAILEVARGITGRGVKDVWGVYHAAGSGSATWCDLAGEVLACAAAHGVRPVPIEPIGSESYPTAAARPKNAVLDCSKLERVFGLRLPDWREGVAACVKELLLPA